MAPKKGPLRSTTSDAPTTIAALVSIFITRSAQKEKSKIPNLQE